MKIISAPDIRLKDNIEWNQLESEHKHLSDSSGKPCEYESFDGKKILVFHGNYDGSIAVPIEVAMTADIIICCWPRYVITRYPELANKIYSPVRKMGTILRCGPRTEKEKRFLVVRAVV